MKKKSNLLRKLLIGALAVMLIGTSTFSLASCSKSEPESQSGYEDSLDDYGDDYDDDSDDYDDYDDEDDDSDSSIAKKSKSKKSKAKKSKAKKSKAKKVGGVSAKFKKFVDGYEKFMDGYIDFMKKYNANPTDAELLSAYSDWMSDYADWAAKIEDVDEDELSAADAAYYLKVTARVTKKLSKVQ